jgi:hypothetical protein
MVRFDEWRFQMIKFSRCTSISMIIGTMLMTATAETAYAALDCVSISDECTGSIVVPEQATELGSARAPLNLLFPIFDSTLGTLTGASVVVSGTMYTLPTSNVTNISASPQTFTASERLQFALSDATRPSSSLGTALASALFASNLDPRENQHYINLASDTEAAFGPYVTSDTATLANTGGTAGIPVLSLADMQASGGGTDTLDLYTATTTSNTGAGGNVQESFATNASLNISVVYDFTPPSPVSTPEPASLAMLGAGIASLGIIRRRRKG